MTVSDTSARPIQVLREHITVLEATITLCLAAPQAKSVHRLRTTTRRIEGQLAMFEHIPGVPKHDKLARESKRILKKLRRAAGEVRDIDVQIDLIEAVVPKDADQRLRKDSKRLRESLEEDREDHAKALLKMLKKKQAELALALELLMTAVDRAKDVSLTATELAALTRRWFQHNLPHEPRKDVEDPDYLHGIRKVAKLARYMAENGPKRAKTPRRLAQSFEDLQQSGGGWHDWLALSEISEDRLGASSALTKEFQRRCRISLAAYRRRLKESIA
jgi:CHAD domain-containing protein